MIGTILAGRYEVTGLLAEGPVFWLYSARDRLAGRELSLRVVRSPFDREPAFLDALEISVKKCQAVSHPGVERLLSVERDDEPPFLVGELTRAPTLADRIRKLAPFSAPVAVGVGISLCRALDALHRVGIAHGDVSGDNVCLMADGETRLQIAGIWEAYAASPTAGSVVLPSMAPYLAPEVGKGAMPSAGSDVYSVGILLFELLTGRKPYLGDTAIATALRHASDPTPSVRTLNPSVPVVLDEIVRKAMSKEPASRYANAGEMLADLRLQQDALRFGRTLTWPLRHATVNVDNPTTKATLPKPQRVAPRMSAIRDEAEERSPRRAASDRDVPVWMMMSLVFMVAIVISLVGVWFFLNLNRPKTVGVPNIRGLSVIEARSTLQRMGLDLKVGARVPNDAVEPDRVMETQPPAGTKVREHGTVTATLSAGSREVEVPELKGLTPDKAKSVLESVSLALDDQVKQEYNPAVPSGTIFRQTPAAEKKAPRGTKIQVSVNNGEEPSAEPAPTSDQPPKESVYTLGIKLDRIVDPVDLRIEIIDIDGTREIYRKPQDPGSSVTVTANGRGPKATFRIYYGDKLVKEVTKNAEDATP